MTKRRRSDEQDEDDVAPGEGSDEFDPATEMDMVEQEEQDAVEQEKHLLLAGKEDRLLQQQAKVASQQQHRPDAATKKEPVATKNEPPAAGAQDVSLELKVSSASSSTREMKPTAAELKQKSSSSSSSSISSSNPVVRPSPSYEWTEMEQLLLAQLVLRYGDHNWPTVSRMMIEKTGCGCIPVNDNNNIAIADTNIMPPLKYPRHDRTSFFAPRKCAIQFAKLLDAQPRRRRDTLTRSSERRDTPPQRVVEFIRRIRMESLLQSVLSCEIEMHKLQHRIDSVESDSMHHDELKKMYSVSMEQKKEDIERGFWKNSGKDSTIISPEISYFRVQLYNLLQVLKNHDNNHVFLQPVTNAIAPDYDKIIKYGKGYPMDFTTIQQRLDSGSLSLPSQMYRDLMLIVANAMVYNLRTTPVYAAAMSLKKVIRKEMEKLLRKEKLHLEADGETEPKPVFEEKDNTRSGTPNEMSTPSRQSNSRRKRVKF